MSTLKIEHISNISSSGNDLSIDTNGNIGIAMTPDSAVKLSVTGAIGPTNGTDAAPTHTFYSDPDTGMYRSGANALSFSTGGSNALTLNSSQNASFAGTITGSSSITATTTINVGTGGGFYLKQDNSESTIRSESQPIILQTYASSAWQDRLTVTNAGDVGIGETSPDNILHIKTSAGGGPQIELDSTSGTANSAFINFDGTSLQLSTQRDMVDGSKRDTGKSWGGINIIGAAGGSYIQLQTSPGTNQAVQTRMTVEKDGQVGINNTSPIGFLDIIVPQDKVPLVVRSGGKSATGFNATHVMHCYNSIGSSGVWYDVCYVSHSPNIFILGGTLQDNNTALGGARYCSRMYGTYGSVVNTTFAGGLRTTAMNGGVVTGMDYRYLNSGGASGSYRLQVQVTWSGAISTMEVFTTVTGHGSDTLQEDN